MLATKRIRIVAAGLAVGLAAAGIAAALTTKASASPASAQAVARAANNLSGPKISVDRFDLDGYVINAQYTLGRNTGNTFQQTYTHSMVQGVPIEGPFVGVTFPPEKYVALPIGHHQLYIVWLDPTTSAIVDAFVMNFVTNTVYDYAPGSDHPESAGKITVVKTGDNRVP
jgi:hypothetical protein